MFPQQSLASLMHYKQCHTFFLLPAAQSHIQTSSDARATFANIYTTLDFTKIILQIGDYIQPFPKAPALAEDRGHNPNPFKVNRLPLSIVDFEEGTKKNNFTKTTGEISKTALP